LNGQCNRRQRFSNRDSATSLHELQPSKSSEARSPSSTGE
jgi:hypothetical protein